MVGRELAAHRLADQIRRVGPGTPQGRIGAIRSGLRLRSARTGRPVRSRVLAIGREGVVGAREMVRAAGREGTPFLTRIDLLARN